MIDTLFTHNVQWLGIGRVYLYNTCWLVYLLRNFEFEMSLRVIQQVQSKNFMSEMTEYS